MPRVVSLNARTAFNAGQTAEVLAVLVVLTHESMAAPAYLSSDPTQRLSSDPLRYGTISDGIEYEFVLMSAVVPDDKDRVPPSTQLVFENVAADMVAVVRSVTTPARIDLALVMSSSPDDIEEEWTDLRVVRATFDAERVTLDISREPITTEPWPSDRMTRSRFPGLFS